MNNISVSIDHRMTMVEAGNLAYENNLRVVFDGSITVFLSPERFDRVLKDRAQHDAMLREIHDLYHKLDKTEFYSQSANMEYFREVVQEIILVHGLEKAVRALRLQANLDTIERSCKINRDVLDVSSILIERVQ